VIPGYEFKWQVEDQIAALEREKRGHIRDARHLAVIDDQLEVFRAELARMEAAGEDGPVDTNKNRGRSTLVKNSTTGMIFQQWLR
jgi:hypothetical protein